MRYLGVRWLDGLPAPAALNLYMTASCLREALAEPTVDRSVGPVRLGVASGAWSQIRRVAEEMIDTDEDLEQLAAWLVDGDMKSAA